MKHRTSIGLFFLMAINSCSMHPSKEKQTTQLLGKWQLIETLADIGDGNATWQPAGQSVVVEFSPDGKHIVQSGSGSKNGTFEIDNDSSVTIRRDGVAFKTAYKFNGEILQLTPPCIEACGERYKRLIH